MKMTTQIEIPKYAIVIENGCFVRINSIKNVLSNGLFLLNCTYISQTVTPSDHTIDFCSDEIIFLSSGEIGRLIEMINIDRVKKNKEII